jgi:hypothetical protein
MTTLTKRDWLLILLAYQGAPDGLDPVRVQQALFLFAETGDALHAARYSFVPGPYGPMSDCVYRDLDRLVEDGLVLTSGEPPRRWHIYAATAEGRTLAGSLLTHLRRGDRDSARILFDIKQQVVSSSFAELLERVRTGYPEAAEVSVFAPRRPPSVHTNVSAHNKETL